MQTILNRPMLALQVERLLHGTAMDKLVVATSVQPEDDQLETLCTRIGVAVFRGSLDDVLDRYYHAAVEYKPEHVVRLTGDCPLTDPQVNDEVIGCHLDGNYDYTSNTMERTFPDGLDVEVMRFSCLAEAWREAVAPYDREHVTPFIYSRPRRYRIGNYIQSRDLSAYRWTVDESEDFEFVSRVYEALYPGNKDFSTEDILALLQTRPELVALNEKLGCGDGLPAPPWRDP